MTRLLVVALAACNGPLPGSDADHHPGTTDSAPATDPDDQDGDGSPATVDCDDADAAAFPGAPEVWYDGVDEACDGGSDWDQDGDGFTIPGAPDGDPTDCDDADAGDNPGISKNDDLVAIGFPGPFAETSTVYVQSEIVRVSPVVSQPQHHATVSWGPDGRWMSAWQFGRLGEMPHALGQLMDDVLPAGDGQAISPTGTEGIKPDIESWPGGYIVAYEEGGPHIWLRGYSPDGLPVTDAIAAYTGDVSLAPDLAVYPDGSGVVAWVAEGADSGVGTHMVQRFGADLQPIGAPVALEEAGETVAEVSPRADGGYVVVATRKAYSDHMEVYGRVVKGDGCISNFRADMAESDAPSRPTVEVRPDGTFAVTWRAKVAIAVGAGVYGRFFDERGYATTDSFQLSRDGEDANRPVLAFWGDDVVFSWEGDALPDDANPNHDVSTWVWSFPEVAPISARFLQNEPGLISAERPSVSVWENGDGSARLVTTWEQVGPDTRVDARITELTP